MNIRKLATGLLVLCATALTVPRAANAVIDNADSLYVAAGETYTLGGSHTYNVKVRVDATGFLFVAAYTGAAGTGNLELHAPTIMIAGTILGDGCGYRGLYAASGEGPGGGPYPGGGGGYGGAGGASGWGNPGGMAYGSTAGSDIMMGSGGGGQGTSSGGNGGGMVRLAAGTTLNVSGVITVCGNQGQDASGDMNDGGGGGAGGGVYLSTINGVISGSLYANGGRGGTSVNRRGGGGGGGGRIKINYCTVTLTATHTQGAGAGGTGSGGSGTAGSPGTYSVAVVLTPSITAVMDVPNDQGRQVRVTWSRSCSDASGTPPVIGYSVWRKIDGSKAYPPGDWDYLTYVPAYGEAEYNTVVPTLADSNAAGMHLSTFFVRAATATPSVYYDSDPASGYSVDNLSPAPPASFAMAYAGGANHLSWNENTEPDLWGYRLYRGTSADFVPDESNLISTQGNCGFVDTAPVDRYYKIAAIDFNGNVSPYAAVSPNPAGVEGRGDLAVSLRAENPTTTGIDARFTIPTAGPVQLDLFDSAGRLVANLARGQRVAASHAAEYHGLLAAGAYYLRFSAGGREITRKVIVVR
jgi:hypothetical protein